MSLGWALFYCVLAFGTRIDDGDFTDAERARILQHALTPLPPAVSNRVADDPAAAKLGQFLFYDPRFSANGKVACATCHNPELGFADGRQRSLGLGLVPRHAQSLWNTAYQRWFFWDGRADSLWAQALSPIEDDLEMGSSRLALAHFVYEDAQLRAAYQNLFGAMPDLADRQRFPPSGKPRPGPTQAAWGAMDEVDRRAVDEVFANLGKSIAAFERLLVTGESPFDRFLASMGSGEREATFTASARRGLRLFVGKARCRLCHSGPAFSDGEFHNTGVPPLEGPVPRDPGRYQGVPLVKDDPFNGAGVYSDGAAAGDKVRFLERQPENWGQFKTPGLRNVALSPPYMHQGQFASLEEVVDFYATLDRQVRMGHHRDTLLISLDLSARERADLIAFLKSLTADPPDPLLLRPPDAPH